MIPGKIFTPKQRELLRQGRDEFSEKNAFADAAIAVLYEMELTETRLEGYRARVSEIQSLIDNEKYKKAAKSIEKISHEIHHFVPDDPLHIFNPFGHMINVELTGLRAHIDVITFLKNK